MRYRVLSVAGAVQVLPSVVRGGTGFHEREINEKGIGFNSHC